MKNRRKIAKVTLFVCIGFILLWLAGDLVYSRIIVNRMRKWEATVQFDDDGVREGCREYEIGDGQWALLLIHGFNDSPACFYKLAPALADSGFTCRVMRLPAFGKSTADYAGCDHRQWLRAVGEELRTLREQHEHVSIVAHSLGGAITIRYVLDHPDEVDSVVLLAPAVAVNNERSPVFSARTWHVVGDRILLFTRLIENVYPLDAHSAEALAYPWQTRFVPRRATTEFFRVVDSIDQRAADFTTPLMMVLSKEDQVIDWQAAKRFHDTAASDRKKLRYVADAGHVIPFDNGWEELAADVAQFVRSAE